MTDTTISMLVIKRPIFQFFNGRATAINLQEPPNFTYLD